MDEALKKEVTALIAEASKDLTQQVGQLADAVKPVSALVNTVGELTKNVKIVADTVASLPAPAAPAAAAAGDKGKGKEESKYLTAEDLVKVLDDRDKSRTADASKAQAKAQLREKVIAAKLPGVPKSVLASLPDTEDEAALTAAADTLRKDLDALGVKAPDVGGAGKDGGKSPAQTQANGGGEKKITAENSGLTPAVAAYANTIKLPNLSPPPNPPTSPNPATQRNCLN